MAFLRHVLEKFRLRTLTASEAALQLNLSYSRRYALATACGRARARKWAHLWTPDLSGGDQAKP